MESTVSVSLLFLNNSELQEVCHSGATAYLSLSFKKHCRATGIRIFLLNQSGATGISLFLLKTS